MTEHIERKTELKYKITCMYLSLKRRALSKSLPYLTRTDFIEFANSDSDLKQLFADWVDSNFLRGVTPTVDRIIPERGYVLDNMQFLTLSKNVSKGNAEVPRVRANNRKAVRLALGVESKLFRSGKEACDFLGMSRAQVCLAIKSKRTLKGWIVSYAD